VRAQQRVRGDRLERVIFATGALMCKLNKELEGIGPGITRTMNKELQAQQRVTGALMCKLKSIQHNGLGIIHGYLATPRVVAKSQVARSARSVGSTRTMSRETSSSISSTKTSRTRYTIHRSNASALSNIAGTRCQGTGRQKMTAGVKNVTRPIRCRRCRRPVRFHLHRRCFHRQLSWLMVLIADTFPRSIQRICAIKSCWHSHIQRSTQTTWIESIRS
jgi:hypothetical protein